MGLRPRGSQIYGDGSTVVKLWNRAHGAHRVQAYVAVSSEEFEVFAGGISGNRVCWVEGGNEAFGYVMLGDFGYARGVGDSGEERGQQPQFRKYDVDMQNEATQTKPTRPGRDQPYLKTLETRLGAHFLRFGEILSDPQRFGPQVGSFKEEGNFSYNVQLSDRQELLRSSRNLDRKIAPPAWRNTPTASVRGIVSREPKRAFTQILSDSLQCDPQVHNFKKEDTFRHDVQFSDRRVFPRSSRNLNRKTAFRRAKNTLTTSVRGTVSLKPKLNFPQVHNFKKEGIPPWGQIPPSSLPVDLQAQNLEKDYNSDYKTQLSVRRKHLPFGRNLRRKNNSDTSTSRSHDFSIRTLIHANFISLESRLLKLSNDIPHDPF
uniref:Uncharacterized protein n=1 Tax=Fagus sylvatica TaxID=28930 RepID=A0A2N9FM93_FAGSY